MVSSTRRGRCRRTEEPPGRPDELGGDARVSIVPFRLPEGVGVEEVRPSGRADVELDGALVSLRALDAQEALWRLTTWAHDAGERLDALAICRPTLEDVILQLMGEPGA